MSRLRNRYLLLLDALFLPLATLAAFAIRFEGGSWPSAYDRVAWLYVALALPLKLLVMWRLRLYARLWRYASAEDLRVLGVALVGSAAVSLAVGLALLPLVTSSFTRLPYSVAALDALLSASVIALPRVLVRLRAGRARARRTTSDGPTRRGLIVGAGAAGAMIVRELIDNPQLALVPAAALDDDPSKFGRELHGVPIVGTLDRLPEVCAALRIDEVIIAMPSAPGRLLRRVVESASEANVPTRTVPGVYELIDGRKSVSALRRVEIADLLRRETVQPDLARVRPLAEGKVVLVTGAGGSIGSELCRQIATLHPAKIIAVGRGENSIFDLQQELREVAAEVVVQPVIADVRDERRLREVFERTRPQTVFHAAAHKHVPLMEANVAEAILNNVLGTAVVARHAWQSGVRHFVNISSDKAVRPTSVMGATKRLAEGVVQQYNADPSRRFVSVRFGNVLGSRGSVIPTFLRQVQAGGPVTITSREMRRYFMTIPEAVQLVLQAGVDDDGDVFVLDMGEPVRIYDLARDVIRLSGLEEGTDIEIVETGVRPGEKLYEELFFDAESATPTDHPKVLRAKHGAIDVDGIDGSPSVDELIAMARDGASDAALRTAIKALVPDYTGATAASPPHAAVRPAEAVPRIRARLSASGFAEANARRTGDRA